MLHGSPLLFLTLIEPLLQVLKQLTSYRKDFTLGKVKSHITNFWTSLCIEILNITTISFYCSRSRYAKAREYVVNYRLRDGSSVDPAECAEGYFGIGGDGIRGNACA